MQNAATSKPKKKGLKMPHLLVLILSLLVLMSLMTYIIPAGQFGTDPETGAILSDQFHLLGYQTPVNPWRALTLILDGLTSSGMIIGLLLAAGGYTGVVLSTKAIDETVDYAIYKLQDKGINVLIPVVFFIYCFIGAFASGDQIIAMVPVGLMFAKKLRLDPIIGMSIVILAYFVGGLSSPTGAMLPQLTMGLELYSGFFVRFVIFLVLSTVAMLFVLRYAKRVAKDPRNSVMDPADWLDQESTGAADSLKAVELSRSSAIVVVLFLLQPIVSLILVSVIGEPRGAMVAVMLIWTFLCGKIKGLSTDEIGGRFAKGARRYGLCRLHHRLRRQHEPGNEPGQYPAYHRLLRLPAPQGTERRRCYDRYVLCHHPDQHRNPVGFRQGCDPLPHYPAHVRNPGYSAAGGCQRIHVR